MANNETAQSRQPVATAYMHLGQPGRTIARTVAYSGGAVADYDEHGQIIGVEAIGIDLLTAAFRCLIERSDRD